MDSPFSSTFLSRRQYLETTWRGIVTSAAISVNSYAAQAGGSLHLPAGIQLYSIKDEIDADAPSALEQIAKIGYKEVEPAGFGSLKTASAFRKALNDAGLKCPSAHLRFDLKNLGPIFEDANTLECKYATASVPRLMIMPPMQITGKPTPEQIKKIIEAISAPMSSEELKRLTEAMNTAGVAAKKAGLTFAAHNHVQEFSPVDGKPAMDYMMAQTDPESVKFEFDCGWMFVAGQDPGDFFDRFPGRAKMLHIKDFLAFEKKASPSIENGPQGTELGRGVMPNRRFLAESAGKGIEHCFVEQEGPFKSLRPMEAAKVNYLWLRSVGEALS